MSAPPTLRVLLLALLSGAGACGDCGSSTGRVGQGARADGAVAPANPAKPATRTVAELDGPIDALVAAKDVLFGASRGRGVIFSVALSGDASGSVRELSSAERGPFAIVARAGNPVWASGDGVFVCDRDGQGRRALAESGTVRALASGPHDIVFSDARTLWRVEWPQAQKAIRLADGADADEIVVTDEAVVWLERASGDVWELDLKSSSRRRLAAGGQRPHDLSLANDGHSAFWHEGGGPHAFSGDTVSGVVRTLAGAYESESSYLFRGACVFGPARCKPLALVDWTRFDTGEEGQGPVADDPGSFYWVAPAAGPARRRIVAAAKDRCCR